MQVSVPQSFTYEIEGTASLSDIAQSLVSIERITKDVGPFLEGTVKGLTVEKIEISLQELTHRSPVKEIFWTAVFLTYQKDLEKEVPSAIEKLTGAQVPDSYDTIVTVITLLIIFYGVDWVYQRITQGGPSRNIKKMFDGLVDDAATSLGVSKEQVLQNLEERYSGNKVRSIAKAAVNFFSIAKRKKGARVLAGSKAIEREVIADIPSDVDVASFEMEEISEPYEDVEIELHAQDVDRPKMGWAGVVREVSEDRLRMTLYPPIQPEDIYRMDSVRGDIIVISKRQDNGEYKPYMFHLVRLRE